MEIAFGLAGFIAFMVGFTFGYLWLKPSFNPGNSLIGRSYITTDFGGNFSLGVVFFGYLLLAALLGFAVFA
jgi:hypothetical protein